MLAHARRRLGPAVALHEVDMRELDLGGAFDAVTCLSSSIAWLPDRQALGRAVQAMARHLTPGGVLVVEPWDEPIEEPDPTPWTRTVRHEGVVVSLMETTVLDGDRWRQDTHYLVWTDEGIEHIAEQTSFSAFARADLAWAFELAGLNHTYDDVGPHGRGLWIGVSPRAATS
jgi:SAM-dependent methyltransferase